MENQENDSGFWNFFINAAVVVAAGMLYFKTAEVMTALAPVTLIGQTGLAVLYGTVVALLIEGVTLALHFLKRYTDYQRAEYYKWFLFGISTFCQFLDTALVKDTANQTQTEAFFAWAALGILPAIFFGLLWVRAGGKTVSRTKKPFKGVRRAWKELMDGEENTVYSTDTEVVQTTKPSKNGKKADPEEVNPTIGERS